ncbi:unnamed protein product [Diatraea saccharalis]|uniref:Phosphotransferase n=1 Tax=Diatraea saccharalis TaxID=40085 RepID=A0A9N9WLS6_9NEOP|nr:unnamed protein product [Diatraea saccharalis]
MSTAIQNGVGLLETRLNGCAHAHGLQNGYDIGHTDGCTNGHINGYQNGVENGHRVDDQFLPPPLQLDDKTRAQKITTRLSDMMLGGAELRRVGAVFERELERGLQEEPSSLQMENTYIPELPDGTEEGLFLALDLGGTNFRVLLLELRGGQLVREDVKQYHISDALRLGPGEDLFNFLADCVLDFVQSEGMEKESLSLGFTFSFPMRQHSILSGELTTWTKSFKCGGMEGVDVAALLQRCLHQRGLDVTVRVLLNDTTGTLVAGAHIDPAVGIGVILGTGSNGCYMERADRVRHWEAAHARVHDVCVDVEWGAFGDNGCLDFIRTDVDREVDANSLLVASFTFEKYIGGKYLGEVLRASLAALARDRESERGEYAVTLRTLEGACGARLTEADARVAQHVAAVVSNRAAQLVSVSALLRRMSRPYVVVAVDGSVYKRHPRIKSLMQRYIALLAPEHPFSLLPAEDGSGKGSALTAAIAARMASRSD